MTFENKIVVGLDDIKAVTFECAKCKTRLTLLPDMIRIPAHCNQCGQEWLNGNPNTYDAVASPYVNFIRGIGEIRTLQRNNPPFKILLEFEAQS